jgi:galactoside O-acetyltransferase
MAAQGCESAPVVIEDDVWLGANAVVLPGIRIGKGAIVGAGAVVTHDVEAMSIVAGVPARPIGKRA